MERENLGLPKLELPPEPELSPEELAKRREMVERALRLREEIGPLNMTWNELMAGDEDDDG